ncbi:MAG: type 4a pilus biogenesis protein PilO [Candidatus Eisenbacteria bacterium]|nr:type 4a pilus biogenesis protein PilO [Candidatus Eisenbacteria bacterium]
MAATVAPPSGAAKAKAPTSFADQPLALKIFIAVLAVSMICVLYYFLIHMDLADQIESAERQHTQLLTDRTDAVRRQQEFVRLSQELVEREPIDRRNRRILPENAEIPAFLGDLNRLAELSGLGIDLVQPEPENPEQNYVRIPVRLKLHGKYHQFAKFFHAISQLERAVSMENLDVNTIGDPSAARARTGPTGEAAVPEVPLTVELMAYTFRRPRVEEGAPPPAGGPR